jgi:hypothetical protein
LAGNNVLEGNKEANYADLDRQIFDQGTRR